MTQQTVEDGAHGHKVDVRTQQVDDRVEGHQLLHQPRQSRGVIQAKKVAKKRLLWPRNGDTRRIFKLSCAESIQGNNFGILTGSKIIIQY